MVCFFFPWVWYLFLDVLELRLSWVWQESGQEHRSSHPISKQATDAGCNWCNWRQVTKEPKVAQNCDRLKLFKGEIEIDAVMKDIVGDHNQLVLFPSNCFVKHRESSYNIESKLMFTRYDVNSDWSKLVELSDFTGCLHWGWGGCFQVCVCCCLRRCHQSPAVAARNSQLVAQLTWGTIRLHLGRCWKHLEAQGPNDEYFLLISYVYMILVYIL